MLHFLKHDIAWSEIQNSTQLDLRNPEQHQIHNCSLIIKSSRSVYLEETQTVIVQNPEAPSHFLF